MVLAVLESEQVAQMLWHSGTVSTYSSLLMHMGKATGNGSGTGPLPPTWETQVEFLAPGFSLAQP